MPEQTPLLADGGLATRDVPAFAGRDLSGRLDREIAAARAAGYAAGWTSGTQAARAAVKIEHDALVAELTAAARTERLKLSAAAAALRIAADQAHQQSVPLFTELEDSLLRCALELAQAILGHEVRASITPGIDALNRALALTSGAAPVRIRLSAQDAATLSDTELDAGLAIAVDPSLKSGDSIVELAHGRVELLLDDALARAKDVLAS